MKWLRLWTEILDDPKCNVSNMSDETFRVFILLLAYARELDNAGIVNQAEATIAWRLRVNCSTLRKHLLHLRDLQIIKLKPELKIINWDKRQFLSDDSSERVKRFRIKKGNVTKSLHVTPPETDTDSETDTEIKNTVHSRFEDLWKTYPMAGRRGKQKAEAEFKKLGLDQPGFDSMLQALNNQISHKTTCERERKFCPEFPHLERWLKNRRWEDEIESETQVYEDPAEAKKKEDEYMRRRIAERDAKNKQSTGGRDGSA